MAECRRCFARGRRGAEARRGCLLANALLLFALNVLAVFLGVQQKACQAPGGKRYAYGSRLSDTGFCWSSSLQNVRKLFANGADDELLMRLNSVLRAASLDPYQILSVPRSATTSEIKQAYYALVKEHHPDLQQSADGKPAARGKLDFKDIVSSYELLRDPKRREAYLKYGLGWKHGASGRATGGMDVGFDYRNVHNPWGTPKSRPHRHAHERGRYPSSSWDFGHSDSTDFFSSSRPAQANTDGLYTSNGAFIGILAAMSLLLYSVQFWRLAPPLPSSSGPNSLVATDPREAPIYKQSGMMRGRDKSHETASSALAAAREGAQRWGNARRDNIRRRVREATLDAIESGQLATGHGLPRLDAFGHEILFDDPTLYRREMLSHEKPAASQLPNSSKIGKEAQRTRAKNTDAVRDLIDAQPSPRRTQSQL